MISEPIQLLRNEGYQQGSQNWKDYTSAKKMISRFKLSPKDYEEFIKVISDYLLL